MSAAVAVSACPAWCALPEGHPYNEVATRLHTRALLAGPGAEVDVMQAQDLVDGVEVLDVRPGVYVNQAEHLDAGQARRLAQALLAAAEVLDGARA